MGTGYLDGSPDLADLIQAMSRHQVRYLVVGGHAVGFHSRPRATKDLDLWIDGSEANKRRVVDALREYAAPEQVQRAVLAATTTEIVWFGRPPNRVDLIQTLPGVEFDASFARAVRVTSGGQKIPIIGLEDLIANKEAVGRDQDKVDVKMLRRRLSLE